MTQFKAWDNKNKRWVESFFINKEGQVYGFSVDTVHSFRPNACVIGLSDLIDATLCRNTGLKDCKGNMIFENDIIEGHYGARNEYKIGPVYWNTEYLSWYHYGPLHAFDQRPYRKIDVKILGNVFDNENLLKGGK